MTTRTAQSSRKGISPGSRRRVSGELAAVLTATATVLGSFGLVVSGIWMIQLAVN
jgi:hypothetical protein